MRYFLKVFFVLIAVGFGFWWGTHPSHLGHKKMLAPQACGIDPQKEVVGSEPKSFVFVVIAHNAAAWCERALHSIFEQDYEGYRVVLVDDASIDNTLDRAQQLILDLNQDHRVIIVHNDVELGPVGCIHRAAEQCQDSEIVIPIDAHNWLVHDLVLKRLAQIYQNPDTWITWGQSVEYPNYRFIEPPDVHSSLFKKYGYRSIDSHSSPALSFYAALFKSIQLSDLFVQGHFSHGFLSFSGALAERSNGRIRMLSEPLLFMNGSIALRDAPLEEGEWALLRMRIPCAPLNQLSQRPHVLTTDLFITSNDRPLQLWSTLESIHRSITGFSHITVLYRATDEQFEEAYRQLQRAFPRVRYVRQTGEFKSCLMHALDATTADCIALGTDEWIVTDTIDLTTCSEMLQKTGATGFYFHLGRNIQEKASSQPQAVPDSVPLNNGIFAWDLRLAQGDWRSCTTMNMTLYSKSDLIRHLVALDRKAILLDGPLSETAIGLYFDHSKIVQLPTNDAHRLEDLVKFNQGFKIDIDPLFQAENTSIHTDYIPEFIPR